MPAPADVSFPASYGRRMRGALALPTEDGPRPGVVVIHEVFGLNEDIRRITGRVADLGYVALAPDLYDGAGVRVLCVLRTMLALRRRQGQAFTDLDAAGAWLSQHPRVDGTRLAVVGFCMGGGYALLYALRTPLRAAGVFYGDVPRTAEELQGVCPVVAGYGGRDRLFASQGRRLESLLSQLGVPHDVRIYPGAGHSYMSRHEGLFATLNAWGPLAVGFDAHAESDSWVRLGRFFQTHLG